MPDRPGLPRNRLVELSFIVGLTALAISLRFWAIDWGRPFNYYPDEYAIFRPAFEMLIRHDPNPHDFQYPSRITNSAVLAFGGAQVLLGWPLVPNVLPPGANGGDLLPALFPYLVVGRGVVALYGTGSCLLIFGGLRRLGAGIASAAAGATTLAIAPLAVTNAHYLTTDVPSSFGTALTLLGVAGILTRRTARDAVIAGLGSGLAASAKYNAGLVVLVPLLALVIRSDARKDLRNQVALLVVAGLSVFVATSPFVVLEPAATLAAMQAHLQDYQGGHLGAQGSNNIAWYGWTLVSQSWGFGLSALAGVGLIVGSVSRTTRRVTGLLIIFGVAYVVAMGLAATRFDRNLMPVLPGLAFSSGIGIWVTGRWQSSSVLPRTAGLVQSFIRLTGAALVIGGLLPAVVAAVRADNALTREDTRSIAFRIAEAKLPANSRVAVEWYTPQLEWTNLRSTSFSNLGAHPVSWYRAEGYDYLVLSSYMYGRFFSDPTAPPASTQAYRDFFALPVVFEVVDGPDAPGPTIRVYSLAE